MEQNKSKGKKIKNKNQRNQNQKDNEKTIENKAVSLSDQVIGGLI